MTRFLLIALLLVAFGSSRSYGQLSDASKAVAVMKARYVYHFATQIDWPTELKKGNFTIGVYGEDNLYDALVKDLSSRKRSDQPFKIVKYKSAAEIKNCHIIVLGKTKSSDLSTISKAVKGKGTLIVTDKSGLIEGGSMINFVYPNSRTRFEVNKSNAEKNKLVIGKQITSMATVVK